MNCLNVLIMNHTQEEYKEIMKNVSSLLQINRLYQQKCLMELNFAENWDRCSLLEQMFAILGF